MPMEKSTFKSILLLGNHAHLYLKEIQKATSVQVHSFRFVKRNPFNMDEPHRFMLNDTAIDFNGKYTLEELSFAISVVMNHHKAFEDCLVLGDPTELMFQAFCFAKNNQNPHLIRQEVQFEPKNSKDAYVFIYPSGMVAHNIRKEISNLIYLLKKHKGNAFLIRNKKQGTSEIVQNMLKKVPDSFDINILGVDGIEQIISNETEFTS
jgi:hypothetical protein